MLETPAYQRTLVERPGYREFTDRKWDDLSEIMWGAMAMALAHQPDDLAALAAAVRVPMLVIVGAQDTPFVGPSQAMADAIEGAELVVVPDAGHSPQFENPQAWIDALSRFLASVPSADQVAVVEAHGGRLAVEVLQRHDVDTMFTLSGGHLFVLYDGAVQAGLRLVDVRHEQTATFAAEGLREGDAPARAARR